MKNYSPTILFMESIAPRKKFMTRLLSLLSSQSLEATTALYSLMDKLAVERLILCWAWLMWKIRALSLMPFNISTASSTISLT